MEKPLQTSSLDRGVCRSESAPGSSPWRELPLLTKEAAR